MKPQNQTAAAFNASLDTDACRSFHIDPASDGFASGIAFLLIELFKQSAATHPEPERWIKEKRETIFKSISRCHPPQTAPAEFAVALDTVDLVTSSALNQLLAQRR